MQCAFEKYLYRIGTNRSSLFSWGGREAMLAEQAKKGKEAAEAGA